MTTRVEYRGPAPFVSALAQTLREEGVTVDYSPPSEERGAGEIAQEVIVNLLCMGGGAAIKAAVDRFRAGRLGKATTVTLFSSEDADKEV